ncbi:GNAT family N-acetyltransferase [Ruminococcaceae bacterium OttesenSCG-928-D13]|nr:GNAT family N-acetyltransferase [Ruminococcaceae bacterium OttesenSCG-928-D13]
MPNNVTIRPATLQDAGGIAELCRVALGYDTEEPLVEERLPGLLSNPTHKVVVAETDGELVGFAHACDYDQLYSPPMKNLMAIAVTHGARGRGIGKLLLAEMERWAHATGAFALRVVSGEARLDAHHMYRSAGYGGEKGKRSFYKIL